MEYGAPYTYQEINVQNSRVSPSVIHVNNTRTARYYQKYLLQKAMSVFKWKIPDTWSKEYMLFVLYITGHFVVFDTPEFGTIPQRAALSEFNVFYQPATALVANPLLPGLRRYAIGTDCTVIKLQPDYTGIWDMIEYYAGMMALAAEAVAVNLLNSKMAYMFAVPNKAAAETMKKVYDKVAGGEPSVVYDEKMLGEDGKPCWQMFSQNVGENYIVGDLLSDMRKIESAFDTEIGIPNANTDKRERLVTDEVNANNTETASKASMWLEQLQFGCEQANKMFKGLDMSVDWRVNPMEGVKENAGNPFDSRIVPMGQHNIRRSN